MLTISEVKDMKVKIDNLFLAVELKWTEDKFNTYYGELKMMDSKIERNLTCINCIIKIWRSFLF
jgi:hypothetical protein